MQLMRGRKYIYQFTADQIILVPRVDEVHAVTIVPYDDEDYSIFDFGPEICKEVQVGAESCTISDVGTFENLRVTVLQPNPGNNIEIIIRDLNYRVIIDITDIIYKYNRGESYVTEPTTPEEYPEDGPIIPVNPDPITPEPEPEEPEEPEIIDDETKNPTLDLDGNSYLLLGNKEFISVYQNENTNVTEVTISGPIYLTVSGTGTNVFFVIKDNISGVKIIFKDTTLSNARLSMASGYDISTINIGKSSIVDITVTGENTIAGPVAFSSYPVPLINCNKTDLRFHGEGTLNIIDGLSYDTDYNDTYPTDGIFNSNGTILFQGGTYNIKTIGSCIYGADSKVTFEGGIVNCILSYEDAISAIDGTVEIIGGTLNIRNAYGCGISATRQDTEEGGNVYVYSGILSITECYGDGIEAETVEVSGGTVNITTVFNKAAVEYYTSAEESDYQNTITQDDESTITRTIRVNLGSHCGIKAGTETRTNKYLDINATDSIVSSGGLSITGGYLTINTSNTGLKSRVVSTAGYEVCGNGEYIIGSPADALHSNNALVISGSPTININASDNGIFAYNSLVIIGNPLIGISNSYIGLKAGAMILGEYNTAQGPTLSIISNYVGICAEKEMITNTYQSMDKMRIDYTSKEVSIRGNNCVVYNGEYTIKLDSTTSKTITLRNGSVNSTKNIVYASMGNGFRCSGSLTLEGGVFFVYGQSRGEYCPIFTRDNFIVQKAVTLLATGTDPETQSLPTGGDGVYVSAGSGAEGEQGMQPEQPWSPPADKDLYTTFTRNGQFTVRSGPTPLYDTLLPYAGTFVIYMSPKLVKDNYYITTIGTVTRAIQGRSAT